jgi:hypothetical protein
MLTIDRGSTPLKLMHVAFWKRFNERRLDEGTSTKVGEDLE